MKRAFVLTFALLAATASVPAFGQHMDHGDHDAAAAAGLPEICTENADHVADMPAMEMDEHLTHSMSEGHQAMMANMGAMHDDMTTGMMAEDFDVAFVCGMIPHHQGALDMANAALEYGEDEWVRDLAREIVDAQEREIAEMLDWLEAR